MVQFEKRFVSGHRFKLAVDRKLRPPGLKPGLILWLLRGAEAPLFHVSRRIREFFRNL